MTRTGRDEKRTPDWLRAFYAFLVFMTFAVTITQLVGR